MTPTRAKVQIGLGLALIGLTMLRSVEDRKVYFTSVLLGLFVIWTGARKT